MAGIIIIVIAAGGTGAYLYYTAAPSNYTQYISNLTITTIPGYVTTVQNQPLLTVTVSNASTGFYSVNPIGTQYVTPLSYSLIGPNLTLTSSGAGTINATIGLYNSQGDVVSTRSYNVPLVKGKQKVSLTGGTSYFALLPVVATNVGEYTVALSLSQNSSSPTPFYTKNFSLLAGATGYPLSQSASVKLIFLNQSSAGDVAYYGIDNVQFNATVTSLGNADILGYYQLATFDNGVPTGEESVSPPVVYYLDGWSGEGGMSNYPPTGDSGLGFVYIPAGSAYKTHASTGDVPGESAFVGSISCKAGDSLSFTLSFVEKNQVSAASAGTILNSTTWNGTCP